MRITGRVLRPSNLAERRLMLSQLGTPALRVPRRINPYLAARKLARAARAEHPDLLFVRDIMAKRRAPEPMPSFPVPDRDGSDPEGGEPPMVPAFVDAVATA
jgi:hypothetical protein